MRLGWGISVRRAALAALLALPFAASSLAQPVPAPMPKPAAASPASAASDPIGALIAQQQQQASLPVVIGMRLAEQTGSTRLVIELSDPVRANVYTLADAQPSRVVIDLPEVLWRIGQDTKPSGKGLVDGYRYGLFRPGNSRFVIDLNKPARVNMAQLLPPEGGFGFRLVLDLVPTTPEDFAAHSGWLKSRSVGPPTAVAALPAAPVTAAPPAAPTPAPAPPAKANAPKIIIVDAGHGGIDPGTHGATGLQEKDIVLAVAKDLRTALESRGGRYKVKLTRDTDVFIPLGDRVKIARANHGDLFVSLHIDFNDHHEIRGASIYTLSDEATDPVTARLAEQENKSDVIAGVDLTGNNDAAADLIGMEQRLTKNSSIRFAETVLTQLPAATLVRPTSPRRSAGFAVLKGPDIPAVLIELGYLSNTQDEAEMQTNAWRKNVAEAVAKSIDRHFAGEPAAPQRQAAAP
jgi:N-acetylmuramoyl-L-alanine amidase